MDTLDIISHDNFKRVVAVAHDVAEGIEVKKAEKRMAQDGRTTVTVGDTSIDLRISVIPTSYGERAVLRLLDKSRNNFV